MKDQIENNFKTHKVEEAWKLEQIREEMKCAAFVVNDLCKPSRETSLAVTKLEEAMFWANASISRNQEK